MEVKLDQHSGYVTVDAKAGRALFYYFVESANSSTEPLVLWLNGVNICSSLAEPGPFRVNSDGKCLSHQVCTDSAKYLINFVNLWLFFSSDSIICSSWSLQQELDFPTRIRHLIMMRTAEDSYTFLVNWFERFPEYKAREFFLAGESYADPSIQQDFQSNFHQFKRPSCEVPTRSTGYSMNKLGAQVNTPWYPWYTQGEHSLSSLFLDGKLPSQTRS
ncbi:hypothetical protein KPL71_022874 [Citrus sinensis]|uniref:Uncharacterized protein n=1 Tax=Citrus sinensis TaxID=2711 RepID=A0ACB8IFE3_CITSI|nr:hypothetical protein KPL71_022874 [Citrus sinensis]